MTALPPDPAQQEIAFRLSRSFRRPLLERGLLSLIGAAVCAFAATRFGPPLPIVAGLFGLDAVVCAVGFVWRGRFRTVLTPRGIYISGYFNRFVPWTDVAGFQLDTLGTTKYRQGPVPVSGQPIPWSTASRYSGRRVWAGHGGAKVWVVVRVVRVSGPRLTLRAPCVTNWSTDSEFDDKLRLIEKWRQLYGPPAVVTAPGWPATPG
jgi:hypothetical protein